MKTKEELLKIYSAYLPYGFEVKTGMGYSYEVLGVTRNLYDRHGDVGLLTDLGWVNMEESLNNKPILYSMDMLTKEIEHKGERFIPIIFLYNISNERIGSENINYEFIESWGAGKILKVIHEKKGEYTEFIYHDFTFRKDRRYEKSSYVFGMDLPHPISVMQEIKNQKWMHEMLLEWNFNVFGLSESEYIKKESLK